MTELLSWEIVAKCFRDNFHAQEVTVTIGKRTDAEGFRVLLLENFTRKQKEFFVGRGTTINDLQDMALTAARLFGYVWEQPTETESVPA